jgi:hypothetical protein
MSSQQKQTGETMTDQTVQSATGWRYRGTYRYSCQYSWFAEAIRDAFMVFSFGLWAAVLGFVPLVAFCMLRAG